MMSGGVSSGQNQYFAGTTQNKGNKVSYIRDESGGLTVLKENNHNIIMTSGGPQQTNMMVRRNAEQN